MAAEGSHSKEPPTPGEVAYSHMLDEARALSREVLRRLRTLSTQFPTALPDEIISQVERIGADPGQERRRLPRLRGTDIPASVAGASDLADWEVTTLVDYSPAGLAIRLKRPIEVGAVLLVWMGSVTADTVWCPLAVKHCRLEGDSWVVGGEFLRNRLTLKHPGN